MPSPKKAVPAAKGKAGKQVSEPKTRAPRKTIQEQITEIEAKIEVQEAKVKELKSKKKDLEEKRDKPQKAQTVKGLKLGKYIAFKRNGEEKYGQITGIFIGNEFQVSLCKEDGTDIDIPAGAKKVRLNTTVVIAEVDRIIEVEPKKGGIDPTK